MKFSKGQKVIDKKTNKIKTIQDCEVILDVEIYYLDDNTSRNSEQLGELNLSEEQILFLMMKEKNVNALTFIDVEKSAENFARNFLKKYEKYLS